MKISKTLLATFAIVVGIILIVICPVITFATFGFMALILMEGAVLGIVIVYIGTMYLIIIHK